jgi:hypothetical protein
MSIPSQQHAEIVEPGHYALQFDPIHQKNGEWDFAFADVIEEGVLQILRTIGCHCRFPFLLASSARDLRCPSPSACEYGSMRRFTPRKAVRGSGDHY